MTIQAPPTRQPRKVHGARHAYAAAGYSFDGFRRMLRETAFRHELLVGLSALGVLALSGAQVGDYLVQVVLLLVLLAVEALNTAIEVIVDRVSPELSSFAKQAKDLGSFSVFCLLAANAAFVSYVVWRAI